MKQNSQPMQPIAEIYDEWKVSGQTIAEFSRKKGINPDRLYYRRSYLAGKRKSNVASIAQPVAAGKFVPVADAIGQFAHSSITVTVGKVNITYEVDTDDQLFLKLINLLKVSA